MFKQHKSLMVILMFTSLLFSVGMGNGPASDNKAVDFTLKDLSGNDVTLSSFFGKKIVVLNFFRVDCPSCNEEVGELQILYDEYKSKGVEVISVNLKDSEINVANFAKYHGLTYKILLDNNAKVGNKYKFRYVPSNFIIDKEGTVVHKSFFMPIEELKKQVDKTII